MTAGSHEDAERRERRRQVRGLLLLAVLALLFAMVRTMLRGGVVFAPGWWRP